MNNLPNAETLASDIDAFSRKQLADDPRSHLGASIIGDECKAKLWTSFRWLKQEEFDGRKLRLFERGKDEENKIVTLLKGIGFTVWQFDENGNQFGFSDCNGHFGGSIDGVAKLPEKYGFDEPMLLEFKTHSEKSFVDLKKKGVALSKPKHMAQMSVYGLKFDLRVALYVAVNKNTDELYFEFVELDYNLANVMLERANEIIYAREMPAKIAKVSTFYLCKMCPFSGICFREELPEKNCRSCVWAEPMENGGWICNNAYSEVNTIDKFRIKSGCKEWQPIVNNQST
jgi:hypothetical protein